MAGRQIPPTPFTKGEGVALMQKRKAESPPMRGSSKYKQSGGLPGSNL